MSVPGIAAAPGVDRDPPPGDLEDPAVTDDRVTDAVPMPSTGAPLLIVNADDFGLTKGTCSGILRAYETGIVTSTSALVVAPAFDENARALRESGVPVGCHLAAVGEDPPLLSAKEIPSLVDRSGRFPVRWQQFLRRAARGAIDTGDLEREFAAQIQKLNDCDVRITHLDSHQNLHLWPQMATVMLGLAQDSGIRAIRLPRSAAWNPTAMGVRTLSRRLERCVRRSGHTFPDASLGLDEVGDSHDGAIRAIRALAAAGAGSAELVVHLGEDPDPDRARYSSRFLWGAQLEAVCDPVTRRVVEEHGFRLGSFADL